MEERKPNISDLSRFSYRRLLDNHQTSPSGTLFNSECFERALGNLRGRNEAMIIRDIGNLIVPSAQTFATQGASHLSILAESVNEGWNKSITITKTRPQPDYSVGFGRSAFTQAQHTKMIPFVGEVDGTATTYFAATYRMFFPFLTCEVKSGLSLDIADRQNAHSMTIAVRAVVELYKTAQWEEDFDWRLEINRQILAFSISHDCDSVRIYGHYPVLEEDNVTYHRHSITNFYLGNKEGQDKWTAYKFVKNVYDIWMPEHLKRLQRGIDALPSDVNSESIFLSAITGAQSEQSDPQETGISTPSSQGSKKPRLSEMTTLREQNKALEKKTKEQQKKMHEMEQDIKEEWARQRNEEKERHNEQMIQLKEQIRLNNEKRM